MARFDGLPWREADSLRASWAGNELECQGACVGIKQDLMEAAHTCSFARWDTAWPCFKCNATAENQFEREPGNIDHFPYELFDISQ